MRTMIVVEIDREIENGPGPVLVKGEEKMIAVDDGNEIPRSDENDPKVHRLLQPRRVPSQFGFVL